MPCQAFGWFGWTDPREQRSYLLEQRETCSSTTPYHLVRCCTGWIRGQTGERIRSIDETLINCPPSWIEEERGKKKEKRKKKKTNECTQERLMICSGRCQGIAVCEYRTRAFLPFQILPNYESRRKGIESSRKETFHINKYVFIYT